MRSWSLMAMSMLTILVALMLPSLVSGDVESGDRPHECMIHGPRAADFRLKGVWDERAKDAESDQACVRVRTEPLGADLKSFARCGCTLLEAPARARRAEGMRILRMARRLLPPRQREWKARQDADHVMYRFQVWELADDEHRDLLMQVMELRKEQARTDCSAARALVVHLDDLPNLGAALQLLNAAMSFARLTRRIMVMADLDAWPLIDPYKCPSRSWACLFQPLAACSEASLAAPGFEPLLLDTSHTWRDRNAIRVVHARAAYELFVAMGVHSYGPRTNCSLSAAHSTPGHAWQGCPLTWSPLTTSMPNALALWRAALAAELFRPNQALAAEARSTALRIGFNATITAACHIRRGDKVKGRDAQARYIKTARYVQRLQALLGEVGGGSAAISRVFIATDDHSALKEAIAASRQLLPAVRCVHDEQEERSLRHGLIALNDSSVSPDTVAASMDRNRIARDAVVNLALLASAQALVGTWSSAFGKVAQYTRAGRSLLFCESSGTRAVLAAEVDPSALERDVPDVQLCKAGARRYESLDDSVFADFDPL